jgi:hypothetical protein
MTLWKNYGKFTTQKDIVRKSVNTDSVQLEIQLLN